MNILVITNFCQTPNEEGNNRFNYIAKILAEKGHTVEFITSSFSHRRKQQRDEKREGLETLNYKFTMIYEPGYKKNVTLTRFYSHWIFSKNLKKYLNELEIKPDVIYCAIPTPDAGKEVCKYAKKNNIPFIIDIQDLWPEAFKMIFKIPVIKDIVFYPFEKKVNYIYSKADAIVAVSQTYLNRALKNNHKIEKKLVVYLGTDLSEFDRFKENTSEELHKNIKLVYIGTLGHSYDLTTTIDAISILKENGIKNLELVIMGDGPLKKKFEQYAIQNNIEAVFTGRLGYEKMVPQLCECDIAINPISKGAAQSIINKVGDYAAAGLPVINTQECEEYRNLVSEYKIGLNSNNSNSVDMSNKILELYKNKNMRTEMGRNNRKLAEEKFDRKKTYKEIVDLIEAKGKI